jgi:acetolactate synthase-1/2/3 large subunit
MPHDAIGASHSELLDQLSTMDPPRKWSNPFADVGRQRREILSAGVADPISAIGLVKTLAEALPPDTIVTTDVGSHKYLFGQFWPSLKPQTFFMSNGLSGMGYGLSAAIGAKLARPDQPVLSVLGDGGFAMNGMELETAIRLGAHPVIVVLADNSYSLIRFSQESKGLSRYGVDFDHIDTVAVAKACGYGAIRSDRSTEISKAVRDATASDRPLLIEVPIALEDYAGII